MQQAYGWDDGGGGHRGRAHDPSYRWRGATLRPTGVVIFATLERHGPDLPALEPVPEPRPRSGPRGQGHEWRRLALRSAAWLLGR